MRPPCRPRKLSRKPPAGEEQLLRWHGANVTRAALAPRPVDVGYVGRYKLLRGRLFVHMQDRGAVLENYTCKKCVHRES